MKSRPILPLLILMLVASSSAVAPLASQIEACALDPGPAATLLLPYFDVDLSRPDGRTTLFSITNTVAEAVLTRVTLWTDLGIPTLTFHVYLTGYDVETVNLRDVLEGRLPATASVGQDPLDAVSPRGDFSQDIDLDSCDGILPPQPLTAGFTAELRKSHQGLASTLQGPSPRCSGAPLGDGRARGYVTIDVVKSCSTTAVFPSDNGYFGAAGRAESGAPIAATGETAMRRRISRRAVEMGFGAALRVSAIGTSARDIKMDTTAKSLKPFGSATVKSRLPVVSATRSTMR